MGDHSRCTRCGHDARHPLPTTARLRGLLPGAHPPRVPCGTPTDHGWACQCRSRFHAG